MKTILRSKLAQAVRVSCVIALGVTASLAAGTSIGTVPFRHQIRGPAWTFGPFILNRPTAPKLCATNLGATSLNVYFGLMKATDLTLVDSEIATLSPGKGTCFENFVADVALIAGVTIYQETDAAKVSQDLASLAVSLQMTNNPFSSATEAFVPPLLLPSVSITGNEVTILP